MVSSQSTPFDVPVFVRRQRQNQVAVRAVPLLLEADERRHQNRIVHLHVLRAAAVEVAVFLDELKGIGGPVVALRLDDVEVADDEDGLVGSGSPQASDHVAFGIVWPEHLNVRGGKSGVLQTLWPSRSRRWWCCPPSPSC